MRNIYIVIIATLVLSCNSFEKKKVRGGIKKEDAPASLAFGKEYNSFRDGFHIPRIPDDWTGSAVEYGVEWHSSTDLFPRHDNKRVFVTDDTIMAEVDIFLSGQRYLDLSEHYRDPDQGAKRIYGRLKTVYLFSAAHKQKILKGLNHFERKLVVEGFNGFYYCQSGPPLLLTQQQCDSILSTWGI